MVPSFTEPSSVLHLTDALSVDYLSVIAPPLFLTIVDPVAQVTLPPPLVQEGDKGIDVCSAGSTPDDGAGCHHRKLLQGETQNKTSIV